MGQEIDSFKFCEQDFARFTERLEAETKWLHASFENEIWSEHELVGGFELEAWLVDEGGNPAPRNVELLQGMDETLFTSELARFNIELNNPPHSLHGDYLSRMHYELENTWKTCVKKASSLGLHMCMIGILPTVRQDMLNRMVMSPLKRYQALNEQILRQRNGEPLNINIVGKDTLHTKHEDVMLESAATSLQLHLQVPGSEAVAYYNASIIASAPALAVGANSPFLFGRELWDETRIPLFEQSIEAGGFEGVNRGPLLRVSFGQGYARNSLYEPFQENCEHFPILLPMVQDKPAEQLAHLRLHNGTIWRWNRPLIGQDADGTSHLRIEHRTIPGGPSVVDVVANAAFYYGLVYYLVNNERDLKTQIPFSTAKDNFYAAARKGLHASLQWNRQLRGTAQRLILDELLPLAHQGLHDMDIKEHDIEHYLGIIRARAMSGQNGAHWQRQFIQQHGKDLHKMTLQYIKLQNTGRPVHEWPL